MKKINEKWQAIILVFLVIFLLSTGFSSFIIYNKNSSMNEMMNIQQKNIRSVISTIEHINTNRYTERLKSLVNYRVSPERERMLIAMKNKDRAELFKLSSPFYEVLKKEDPNFSSFSWILPNNIVLLRLLKPELFDDEISNLRPDIAQANIDLKPNTGYEVGKPGLEFRIIQPVFYNSEHLGVVQFGLKDSYLLDLIRDNIGIPAALILPDKTANKIEFSKIPQNTGQDYTIQSYDLEKFSFENIDWTLDSQRIKSGEKYFFILKIVDLYNFIGESQGCLYVSLDISHRLANLWESIKFIIFLSILFLIISIVFLYKSLSGLIQKNIDLNKTLIDINASLESEVGKLNQAVHYAGDIIFMTDIDGIFTFINPAFTDIYGFKQSEVLGKCTPRILKSGLMEPEVYVNLWNSLLNGKAAKRELINKTKEGLFIETSCSTSPIIDHDNNIIGFLDIQRDITESKKYENQIKSALGEKESLLRELYHRTQNNMQLISSMLSLKTFSIDNKMVSDVFTDIDLKIQTMALIHQKLFDSQDLSNISLKDIIRELSELYLKGYAIKQGKITLKFDLEEITTLIDIAIPLGLVISELTANSLKHAFPDGGNGQIYIKLKKLDQDFIQLVFSDNGRGVPDNFNFKNQQTLGFETVYLLIEDQLQGSVEFKNDNGLCCTMKIKNNIYKKRV